MNKIKTKIISIIIVLSLSVSISSASIVNASSSVFSWNDFSVKVYCGFTNIFGINNKCINNTKTSSTVPRALAEQIKTLQTQINDNKNISKNKNSSISKNTLAINNFSGQKIVYVEVPETNEEQNSYNNTSNFSNPILNSQNISNVTFSAATNNVSNYVPVTGPQGISGKDGTYISIITQGPTSTTYFIFDPNTNSTSTMIIANSDTLFANNLNTTNATVTNLITTNSTSSSIFSNVLNAVTSVFTNLFATNATVTNLSTTNSSSSNLFSNNANVINLNVTNASETNVTTANLNVVNATATNLITTNSTSSSIFSNVLNAVTSVFTNLFATNATVTNLSTTNSSSSNLFSNNANVINLNVTNASETNVTTMNLNVTHLNTSNNLSLNGNVLTSNVGGSVATTSLSSIVPNVTGSVSSSLNLLTSIVNGNVSTTTLINSNVASSSNNLLQTVVNGISSNAINIINSLNQSVSGNVLTTNINGILATSTIISSSSLSLSGNTLTSSINGISSSLNINNLTSLNLIGNNSNKLTLLAGSSTNNISLTFPSALGTNNQLLSTDNAGNLSFRSLVQSDIPDLSSLYSSITANQTITGKKIISPIATTTLSTSTPQNFAVNYSLLTDMSYSLTGTTTLGAQNETFSGYSATTSFNTNGQKLSSATNWPTTIGTAYYTDYVLVSNTTSPSIQNFSIETAVTGGSGQLIGALSYSLDGGSSFTSVGTFNFLSSSGSFATSTFSNIGVSVSSGANVKFRLYVYASGTITSSRSIYIRNVKFTGQTNGSAMSLRGFDIEGNYNASANQNILSALYINGSYNNNSYSSVMDYDLYQANSSANNYFAGNLGVSQSNPLYALHVGNVSTPGIVARFQNQNGTCDINPTSASLSCSSDMNLKKNIADLETDNDWNYTGDLTINSSSTELDKLMLLKPVKYNWKRESDIDSKHAGFIAQEVEQIFPDLVTTDSSSHLKSLNYLGLIPYTVKAIQEIKESIASSTISQAFVTNNTQTNEDSVININNSSVLINYIESENQESPIDYINSRISKGLSIMTNFVVGRITAIKGYFYEIFANKITSNNIETSRINTNQLCVNNVCITSDQFLKMIQQSGISTSSPITNVNDISTSTDETSTSSVLDNSTSTDATSTVIIQ